MPGLWRNLRWGGALLLIHSLAMAGDFPDEYPWIHDIPEVFNFFVENGRRPSASEIREIAASFDPSIETERRNAALLLESVGAWKAAADLYVVDPLEDQWVTSLDFYWARRLYRLAWADHRVLARMEAGMAEALERARERERMKPASDLWYAIAKDYESAGELDSAALMFETHGYLIDAERVYLKMITEDPENGVLRRRLRDLHEQIRWLYVHLEPSSSPASWKGAVRLLSLEAGDQKSWSALEREGIPYRKLDPEIGTYAESALVARGKNLKKRTISIFRRHTGLYEILPSDLHGRGGDDPDLPFWQHESFPEMLAAANDHGYRVVIDSSLATAECGAGGYLRASDKLLALAGVNEPFYMFWHERSHLNWALAETYLSYPRILSLLGNGGLDTALLSVPSAPRGVIRRMADFARRGLPERAADEGLATACEIRLLRQAGAPDHPQIGEASAYAQEWTLYELERIGPDRRTSQQGRLLEELRVRASN